VAVLAILLFIVASLATYLAERDGLIVLPPSLAAKLPASFASKLSAVSAALNKAQTLSQPVPAAALPVPAVSINDAGATAPSPAKPQSATPLINSPAYTLTPAVTKPQPAIDKGLNTQAIISTSKAADSSAPQLATNLVGMTLVPASGIVSVPNAAPAVKAAPTVKAPTSPLPVSSGVMQGAKISGPNPEYPTWARNAHVSGDVVLGAVITKSGAVSKLSVISGPVGLRESALAAVSKWKYRPYTLNGEPIDVETRITVKFNLNSSTFY
jgi:protein TonB